MDSLHWYNRALEAARPTEDAEALRVSTEKARQGKELSRQLTEILGAPIEADGPRITLKAKG